MRKILLLFLVLLSFSGCEKDDICIDPTTPRLIIEFYDISNPTNLKSVLDLEVTAEGQANALGTFNGVSKIELPLKTTEDVTKYSLKIASTNPAFANEDKLQFDYTRQNVYVSRACGYKTIFNLNDNGVTKTDADTPDGFWIQGMTIVTKNITTENETHIKIYF